MATYLIVPLDYPEVNVTKFLINAPPGLVGFSHGGVEYRLRHAAKGREQGHAPDKIVDYTSQAMPRNTVTDFQRPGQGSPSVERITFNDTAIMYSGERLATSIVDQMRPLQERHMRHWYAENNRVRGLVSGADLDTDAVCIGPATYNVNGVNIAALPNGDRDFAAEARAQTPRSAVAYQPSSLTMQELDEMATEIQERARPDATVGPGQVLARYGHLLTVADQQRLGYVAPPPAPINGRQHHTMNFFGVMLPDVLFTPPADMAYDFGDVDRSTSVLDMMTRPAPMGENAYNWGLQSKDAHPVANVAAPLPGPTAQELAAADEWLRNSPWG